MNDSVYRNSSEWLPTSAKEVEALGWDYIDVIIFSGDAYVDHPSFGAAVIGRTLQAHGLRVAIVPQPNWRDDLRDFKKLGRPRLFFGVSAGAMDSMVNHYTAARRKRSDDAYTPDGRAGMRPDYPTIVYSQILKQLYPAVPVIAGGIEASLRRVSHYDYWQDRLRPSILVDAPVDMIVYGMGEIPVTQIADRLAAGESLSSLTDIPQTALLLPADVTPAPDNGNIILASFETCLRDKRSQATNFKHVEQQSNRMHGATIWQPHGNKTVKINPMLPPMSTKEIDASFDLPYTRLPHPRYRNKTIPAWEMIKHSVNLHRGCFGGCAFCTISAHQGKFIASRSKESILREVKQVTRMVDFKGYISDLGGPSANMYRMGGRDLSVCEKCMRPSCLHPKPCPNLNNDHAPLLDIYKAVDSLPEVKKSFIGSGVRYDLSMHESGNEQIDRTNRRYNEELITRHVSGRLKVAPEHTIDHVLDIMRKPSFKQFYEFKKIFDRINRTQSLKQQLIPYFISSHPGCHEIDMAELAAETRDLNMHLEQVQDFTPTPMTVATEIYYTGYHPYTGEKVYCATRPEEKQSQRRFFFWYDPAYRADITRALQRLHRPDIIRKLFPAYRDPRQNDRNKSKKRR
ncbi:YgiQ family radical SAM protein [Muribaculum gordoncarteri]|uniref:YgiQ family radical SAM protein n=9 Tax=Muribaculum TaxID=1918540 RepID=A0A4P7VN38_9BACT|nr:YgiQ family radical SAM protein [Muribaculum gordoncarteri]QCD35201.1 YgiQ family radical SAM protein [Muribaculum gordoncarteri]